MVDDSVLVVEESPPGSTVVLSVFVFVSVWVEGPGTGTTVLVCVSLVGTTVVECVSTAGGFSTVVEHPARPITASAITAPIPYLDVFIILPRHSASSCCHERPSLSSARTAI